MVNLPYLHDRQTLPEHTVNQATVNHLLWSHSLRETFRGATFVQRMRYLAEVIATVVSETLGRLLTSWNMTRADSQGGKMAPNSHLRIYHLQTRQFGILSYVSPMEEHKESMSILKLKSIRLEPLDLFSIKLVDSSCLIRICMHSYNPMHPCVLVYHI